MHIFFPSDLLPRSLYPVAVLSILQANMDWPGQRHCVTCLLAGLPPDAAILGHQTSHRPLCPAARICFSALNFSSIAHSIVL